MKTKKEKEILSNDIKIGDIIEKIHIVQSVERTGDLFKVTTKSRASGGEFVKYFGSLKFVNVLR